jgi:uncharacterized membrane-anchored protein
MRADSQVRVRREPPAAKVPDITASFWVLKLITTAMGEAASDYLLNTMSFVGLGIGAAGFAITLWVQFEVVPVFVEFEVAVPHLRPAGW